MYSRILCPVDGSPTSNRGMAEAIRLAKDQNAQLRFLHVIDTYFAAMDVYGGINLGELIDSLRRAGEKILSDAQSWAGREGVASDTVLVDSMASRVGAVIVGQAAAWPADLVVMGTHGRRGVSHVLLGSDAETVIRSSPVPVLLMRWIEDGKGGAAP